MRIGWIALCLLAIAASACTAYDRDLYNSLFDGGADRGETPATQDVSAIDVTADGTTLIDASPAVDTGTDATDLVHDAGVDAGSATYTFVVDQLTIDPTDDPAVPHTGFNLDGLYSSAAEPGGCMHADFFSTRDADQNCVTGSDACPVAPNPGCARTTAGCRGGIDNQMPTMATEVLTYGGGDLRLSTASAVSNNLLVIIVRISGVDDLVNDSRIRVALYHAYPTFGTGCSSVLARREYSIAQWSLRPGGTDIDRDAAFAVDGSIVSGRLRIDVGAGDSTFDISQSGTAGSPLPMHSVQVRADLSASSLGNGVIGGWILGSQMYDFTAAAAPAAASVLRGVIGHLVDIRISAVCDGSAVTPPVWGGIGVGYGMHALPATISATTPIEPAQAPGTCGYVVPGDAGPRG